MSSKIVQTPIKIVPFPDTTKFKSNTITIDEPIFDPNDKFQDYDHMGKYLVSASSYADDKHQPFNVFNGGKTNSWKTNFNGNKFNFKPKVPYYCQDPYVVIKTEGDMVQTIPSIYQGGGSSTSKYTTMVGNTPYSGEWIQIELPRVSPAYLFRYSILTPTREDGTCTFPKSFLLVGSKDGNNWSYIDLQAVTLTNAPNMNSRIPITYDINTTDYYFFYRFIFIELFPNNGILEINQINLFAFTEPTPNKNAIFEGFENIDSDGIMYSNLHPFKISNIVDETKNTRHLENVIFREEPNDIIFYLPLFLILLTGSFIYKRFY
jgi:hypothetical protein